MKKSYSERSFVDACYYGEWKKVAMHIRGGVEPNKPDDRGYYPLHMACQEGHLNVVKVLVKGGADLKVKDDNGHGEPALLSAVGEGHLGVVRYLIKNGCDVNDRRYYGGDTPLHIACAWGRFKEVVLLVTGGADINALDDNRHSPIYYAVTKGYIKIVEYLSSHGYLMKGREKKTLLRIAAKNDDVKMVEVLKRVVIKPSRVKL